MLAQLVGLGLHATYWTQMVTVFAFLVLLPTGEHFHIVTALPTLFFRRGVPARVVPAVDMDKLMAAEDEAAAQRTPLIAAFPKLLYGVLAIFPGLIILSILPNLGEDSFNYAVPYAMAYYFPTGMLGVGLVALLAAFMSALLLVVGLYLLYARTNLR